MLLCGPIAAFTIVFLFRSHWPFYPEGSWWLIGSITLVALIFLVVRKAGVSLGLLIGYTLLGLISYGELTLWLEPGNWLHIAIGAFWYPVFVYGYAVTLATVNALRPQIQQQPLSRSN